MLPKRYCRVASRFPPPCQALGGASCGDLDPTAARAGGGALGGVAALRARSERFAAWCGRCPALRRPRTRFLLFLGICPTARCLSLPPFPFISFSSSFLPFSGGGRAQPSQTPASEPTLRRGDSRRALLRGGELAFPATQGAVCGCRLFLERGHDCRRGGCPLPREVLRRGWRTRAAVWPGSQRLGE